MPTPERDIPDWAEKDRERDLAWIGENVHIFWPAAQLGYESVGRGAIVVDTTTRPTGEGHPFGYLDQEAIEQGGDEDTQYLVRAYEPREEFITTLLKPQERMSSYRLKVLAREDLAARVATSDVVDPEEQTEKTTTTQAARPPDLETLMAWEAQGYCEATDGCITEPDGICSHGCNSWLIELGLI